MYYLIIDKRQQGPYTIEQLADMNISPKTMVWTEGMRDWQKAADVPQLSGLLKQSATPPKYTEPTPPQSEAKRQGHGIAKWLVAMLVVLVVMVVTCPNREDHSQAVKNKAHSWMDEHSAGDSSDLLVKLVAGTAADFVIDQSLVVDNYFIFSKGRLDLGELSNVTSLGILGHVFVFKNEDKVTVNKDKLIGK